MAYGRVLNFFLNTNVFSEDYVQIHFLAAGLPPWPHGLFVNIMKLLFFFSNFNPNLSLMGCYLFLMVILYNVSVGFRRVHLVSLLVSQGSLGMVP